MISRRTPDGKEFMQKRRIPIGSTGSDKTSNVPPQPAVVAIRRSDAKAITSV